MDSAPSERPAAGVVDDDACDRAAGRVHRCSHAARTVLVRRLSESVDAVAIDVVVHALVLWKHRHADVDALVAEATWRNERQTLGLFLQLAGELGRDRKLVLAARRLHDKRRSRLGPFFAGPHSPRALAAARRNTPAVAKKWGFMMNMGRDSFESAFEKHAAR